MTMHIPKFRVCRIDETGGFDSLPEGVTKIYGTYLYDSMSSTNCCEATPSYCLYSVGYDVAMTFDGELSEEVQDQLHNNYFMASDDQYYHCNVIDAMSEEDNKEFEIDMSHYDFDDPEILDHLLEAALDSERSNPTWC